MDDRLIVGIADMKLAQSSGMLITYALGSCVGICLYDPVIKLASLTHVMLPLNLEAGRTNRYKYADTGVAEAVRAMTAAGAAPSRMVAKIAGGAKMFEVSSGNLGNIGLRNVESVRLALSRERIRLTGEDVLGTVARTMLLDVESGQTCIRTYGRPEIIF